LKEPGGILLGADVKHRKCWLDTSETQVLVLGAVGSGKSRRVIVPTIWQLGLAEESMVISDTKGELYAWTAQFLDNQGYDVIRIDFREPGKSRRWNPINAVTRHFNNKDLAKASQAAQDVANILTPRSGQYADPVWAPSQKALCAALSLYTALEAPEGTKTMTTVYTLLAELGKDGGKELDKLMDRLPLAHPARAAYGQSRMTTDKFRAGVFGGLLSILELWADINIAYLTAVQDHDLESPGTRPTAIYLVIPDERTTYNTLAVLYIAQLYQALIDLGNRSPGRRLPKRVNFILDEYGNLPAIPDFCTKLTTCRSRNIRFLLAVQGLDQIEHRYPRESRTISGNCWTWIYLLTGDKDTAEIVAEKTGKITIQTENYSSQANQGGHSEGMSQGLAQRYLKMPDEIMRWPRGVSLVLKSPLFPARLPLPDFSEYIHLPDTPEPEAELVTLPEVWLPAAPLSATPAPPPKDDVQPDRGDIILNL
jgi:type IV secretion system protein VirD4